jgi:hypothetical protein
MRVLAWGKHAGQLRIFLGGNLGAYERWGKSEDTETSGAISSIHGKANNPEIALYERYAAGHSVTIHEDTGEIQRLHSFTLLRQEQTLRGGAQ